MENIQESNNNNTVKLENMNSAEPKNITRVRSRSSRTLPVELHHSAAAAMAFSFGDGGLGRRQAPSNILNSPDTNEYDLRETVNKSLANAQEQQHQHQFSNHHHSNNNNNNNRYYWGQPPNDCHLPFPVKVGKSPINHNNSNAVASSGQCLRSPADSVSPPPPNNNEFGGVNQAENSSYNLHLQSYNAPNNYFDDHPPHRVMKDTVEILESPTTTDPDLYLHRNSGTESSPETGNYSNSSNRGGAAVRMIGAVQIADYEGSPRRFGSQSGPTMSSNCNNLHLPETTIRNDVLVGNSPSPLGGFRPGFPQRVVLSTVTATTPPEEMEKCDKGKEEEEEEDDLRKGSNAVPSFDYVYEFSQTRKVLNEFFDNKSTAAGGGHRQSHNNWSGMNDKGGGGGGGGGLIRMTSPEIERQQQQQRYQESSQDLMFLDVISQDGSATGLDHHMEGHIMRNSKNFTLSPETTDYDSNCGDLDSFSNDLSTGPTDYGRLYTAMPVLEDGLSSGHASDAESHHTNQNHQVMIGEEEVESEGRKSDEDLDQSSNEKVGDANKTNDPKEESQNVKDALKEIQTAIQRVKVLSSSENGLPSGGMTPPRSPIWVPRLRVSQESLNSDFNLKEEGCGGGGGEDDELDTDLETDRLLGQQRLEDHFYHEDNNWVLRNKLNLKGNSSSVSSAIRLDTGSTLLPGSPTESRAGDSDNGSSPQKEGKSPTGSMKAKQDKNKTRNKEGFLEPAVLIEGVLFRAKYLGSTQLVCEGQPTKTTRMMQAEEAVSRIKAPEGESQPSTEVDLFISTEKIMVLNTDLKEIMMDHALRTISYIADIGELVVLMARRRLIPQDVDDAPKQNRTPKMICHVFESDEAQFIAQSIGQAFQVAYVEFLKANGIEDHSFVKEMDYQEVLNSQEIFGDELEVFAKKELQKEVVVPKAKGEILGVVIVESGWGSMLPTVVIANLLSTGAAARCGHLNIGDQIIAINGLSLVGLPLSTCQTYIRNVKNQTAVKFTVVPCAPVVEVKIKRPNTKYQLGFSVQNGVICSLLRGGIAERGGVRVGHRIIEINNQSVVAVPHEKIVNLLATSVGEIHMKTMPTSMFRLLTGQENPIFI